MFKKCFHEAEIIDVITNYFEKFNESTDSVVDVNVNGYKAVNAFNGRKWNGEGKIEIMCPSTSFNNEFLESLRISKKNNFKLSYMKDSGSDCYFRVFDCSNSNFIVHKQFVFLIKEEILTQEIIPIDKCLVSKLNVFELPFDNRIFGCTEKLFFAQMKSKNNPSCTLFFLIDSKGNEYGVVEKLSDHQYNLTISNAELFVDKDCSIKQFRFSPKKFYFQEKQTIFESFSQHSLIHRFCLDSVVSFLESKEEAKINYILFSQYSGQYKDFYIVQRDNQFLIHFNENEYEIISPVNNEKQQIKVKYEKNLPVLYLKDPKEPSKHLLLWLFLRRKTNLIFAS